MTSNDISPKFKVLYFFQNVHRNNKKNKICIPHNIFPHAKNMWKWSLLKDILKKCCTFMQQMNCKTCSFKFTHLRVYFSNWVWLGKCSMFCWQIGSKHNHPLDLSHRHVIYATHKAYRPYRALPDMKCIAWGQYAGGLHFKSADPHVVCQGTTRALCYNIWLPVKSIVTINWLYARRQERKKKQSVFTAQQKAIFPLQTIFKCFPPCPK